MPLFSVSNILINSIAACVPSQTEDNQSFELLNEAERKLFIKTIGIMLTQSTQVVDFWQQLQTGSTEQFAMQKSAASP